MDKPNKAQEHKSARVDRPRREELEFGVVGLGKIGEGLALQALEKGMRVVGFDIEGASTELRSAGLTVVTGLSAFHDQLSAPRIVFLYVPAGPIVGDVLEDLVGVLEAGDIVVDGGNSYWGDSIRRQQRYAERGLHLIDLGTSGSRREHCQRTPSRSSGAVLRQGCEGTSKTLKDLNAGRVCFRR